MGNDSKDIFFMLQVDGDCAHSKGNNNKCSFVALMFQIGRLYGGREDFVNQACRGWGWVQVSIKAWFCSSASRNCWWLERQCVRLLSPDSRHHYKLCDGPGPCHTTFRHHERNRCCFWILSCVHPPWTHANPSIIFPIFIPPISLCFTCPLPTPSSPYLISIPISLHPYIILTTSLSFSLYRTPSKSRMMDCFGCCVSLRKT